MSFNEDFHDLIIVRQLLLNRIGNNLANKVEKEYLMVIEDIVNKIKVHDAIKPYKLKAILKEISKSINPDLEFMSEYLTELARKEVIFIQSKANEIPSYELFSVLPSDKTINAIYSTSLMAGGNRAYTLTDWYKNIDDNLLKSVDGAVKIGMMQGETGNEIAKRLTEQGIKTVRDAKAIALTSVSHIAHNAREELYNANSDVIKGWQSQATLDNRTSFICANYDGALYDFKTHNGINDKGKQFKYFPPPRHPNCRSVHLIITKSYKELGLDIDEISTTTRSSLDGAVPKDMTFDEWISKKTPKQQKRYFGAGRYELYKDGKITLSDLVGQNGRVLTLDGLDSVKIPKVNIPKVTVIDFGYSGKFNEYVKDIRDEAKIVINKLPKPMEMKTSGISKGSYYRAGDTLTDKNTIGTLVAKPGNKNTFLHEYGHHIDYSSHKMTGKGLSFQMSMEKEFKEARLKDISHLKDKFKGTSMFDSLADRWRGDKDMNGMSDIFDSLSFGVFYDKYKMHGHGARYYKAKSGMGKLSNTINQQAEVFAQLFEAYANNGRAWAEAKEFYPNQVSAFEVIIKGIIDV